MEVGQLVLVKLTPRERSNREHILTGNQLCLRWSLPKRIISINAAGNQLVVNQVVVNGKNQTVAYNNVKRFLSGQATK